MLYIQCAVIEGTYLAFEYMSTKNGGKGGTVINVSSMGGQSSLIHAPKSPTPLLCIIIV